MDKSAKPHTAKASHRRVTQTRRKVEGFRGRERMCEPGTVGSIGDFGAVRCVASEMLCCQMICVIRSSWCIYRLCLRMFCQAMHAITSAEALKIRTYVDSVNSE